MRERVCVRERDKEGLRVKERVTVFEREKERAYVRERKRFSQS